MIDVLVDGAYAAVSLAAFLLLSKLTAALGPNLPYTDIRLDEFYDFVSKVAATAVFVTAVTYHTIQRVRNLLETE